MWYRVFKYVLIGPLLRLISRPVVTGLHHIPATGPVIIAANHLAMVDSFLLCLVIDRPLTFIAKNEYFTRPGVLGRWQHWFFSAVGQVPVDRGGGDAATAALIAATAILDAGEIWAIHPEGTRSPDGHLHRGRTGVARVALATGAPVIPIGLSHTAHLRPHRRVRIMVGPLLDLHGHDDIRMATDELMAAIRDLTGQSYVDEYARRS